MQILTYTSSTRLPPTIFTENTLLQNTQTRLSYTHIHFTNTTEVNTNCDVLAVDATALTADDLETVKRRYCKTIVWSDNVVETVLWFMETFNKDPYRHYVVTSSNSVVSVEERNSGEAIHKDPVETVPTAEEEKDNTTARRYLEAKFGELSDGDKSIEKIFTRLSLMRR